MPRLYPIADTEACRRAGIDPIDLALIWVSLGVRRIQVRAKPLGADAYLQLLQRTVAAMPPHVEVFANDRPELAELAGCDGVHVGQEDLPVAEVKRTFPRLKVGVSTHDWAQLLQALDDRPDYVAFGPVFQTGSKQNPEPCVGLDGLQRAYACVHAAGLPLVAIGGIHAGNIDSVAADCDFVALIGALTSHDSHLVTAQHAALCAAMAPPG